MRLVPTILCLVAASSVWSVEGPWTEQFPILLAGDERTMVQHAGSSWLVLTPDDRERQALLVGRKEVVLESKCLKEQPSQGQLRVTLGSYPGWTAEGPAGLWATTLDTDNLYVYGELQCDEGQPPHVAVKRIEPAASDAQRIAKRLETLAANDWTGRLKAADWTRAQIQQQPNQEFWLSAADGIISQVIEDAATQAGTQHDLVLLDQTITWAVELLHDTPRAGRLASAPWVRAVGSPGTDALHRRLQRLGLDVYHDQWRPRAEALTLEFEERYQAMGWRDAEGFYRLGRWADANAEALPQAKDRSYRCYQAGLKADPHHAGIRLELGLSTDGAAEASSGGATSTGDYLHHSTGVRVPMPEGWHRGDRLDGDVTWIDPSSETAYLSVSIILAPENNDFEALWQRHTSTLTAKDGYQALATEPQSFPAGTARLLRYRYQEGTYLRASEVLLVLHPQAHVAVRLSASATEEEAEAVHRQLMIAFERLTIPDSPAAAPANPTGEAP